MKYFLFLFLFLLNACGDHDPVSKDLVRERQELEQKVASLNQVIKEMADEISNLQAEIDALNGKLADCEQAELVQAPLIKMEPEPSIEPAEPDKQKKLLDFLENLEKRKK
jgi:septal ring factor EnvC (AmiA/AmiB activator)